MPRRCLRRPGCSPSEAVFVFDTATGRRLRVLALPARAGLPEGGALTASGNHVKVTERGVGKFVDVRTLAESLDYGSDAVRSPRDGFIFTRPGQRLAWFGQGESSTPQLVRPSDGRVVYELPVWVDTVRFSASDRLFVALAAPHESQGELSVWATSSPTPLMRVPCDLDEVADARFSLDDTRLSVLTKQGHVLLYALE